MKNIKIITLLLCLSITTISAQGLEDVRSISTAFPMLLISPDAPASGKADIGVSSRPDVYAQHWNAAKYNFMSKDKGLGLSYVPYFQGLVKDIHLVGLSGYKRISKNRASIGAGVRYFSYGKIVNTNEFGINQGNQTPYDLSLDLSYSLLLREDLSLGVTGRFLNSNLKTQNNAGAKAISTFAADISLYYQQPQKEGKKGQWRSGLAITNIGPKVSYVEGGAESFLPTNLRLGTGYRYVPSPNHAIELNLQLSKLLVPTPPLLQQTDTNNDGVVDAKDQYTIAKGQSNDVGFFSGMFQSFSDAPGGFSEEITEITTSVGAEYEYKDFLTVRTGYLYEDPYKGNRKYATFGAGFQRSGIGIDISYLFSFSPVRDPLENSLRISLSIFPELFAKKPPAEENGLLEGEESLSE